MSLANSDQPCWELQNRNWQPLLIKFFFSFPREPFVKHKPAYYFLKCAELLSFHGHCLLLPPIKISFFTKLFFPVNYTLITNDLY